MSRTIEEMIQDINELKRYDASRLKKVMEAIGSLKIAMFIKQGSTIYYIVHPSTHPGHKGQYQITRFDGIGPTGHQVHKTMELAVAAAIGAHPTPYWNEGSEEYELVISERS
jgi:hypothetical protein